MMENKPAIFSAKCGAVLKFCNNNNNNKSSEGENYIMAPGEGDKGEH